jgi:hypothetical protein
MDAKPLCERGTKGALMPLNSTKAKKATELVKKTAELHQIGIS